MGLEVVVKSGDETKRFRESLGLKKISKKSEPVFESQCVDSWCLAAMVSGAKYPSTRSLYYLVPLRWHRRQLHVLQFAKGGVRRRYGGTMSLGLKRGTLVRHVRYGLCYVGGYRGNRFSLHSLRSGKRLTQNARREEFEVLTRVAFRVRFISMSKEIGEIVESELRMFKNFKPLKMADDRLENAKELLRRGFPVVTGGDDRPVLIIPKSALDWIDPEDVFSGKLLKGKIPWKVYIYDDGKIYLIEKRDGGKNE
jgi:hypothetical protein